MPAGRPRSPPRGSPYGLVVGLDIDAADRRRPRRLVATARNPVGAAAAFLLAADDCHSRRRRGVGLIGVPLRSAVGGRHVGVGADHEAGPAVAAAAHGHLLDVASACMSTTTASATCLAALVQLAVDSGEGIVERVHVDPAQQVDDHDALAPSWVSNRFERARRVGQDRIVQRPDQARFADDGSSPLLILEGAERQAPALARNSHGVLGDPAGGGVSS